MNGKRIRIANVQGFWGDNTQAPEQMLRQAEDVDYLTLDYLAEVSMSILAKQRSRDAELGYARDYLNVVRSLAPYWAEGRKTKIISNAGGLAPALCLLFGLSVDAYFARRRMARARFIAFSRATA